MKLQSNDFTHEKNIPQKFTCDGEDINPHLTWSEIPMNTKYFALTCLDPDAPRKTWVHWLIANIPASVHEILAGAGAPKGSEEIMNDFNKRTYGGPCPPSGIHRYYFTLYALKETITPVTKEHFVQKAEAAALEKAILLGHYRRV